jgi:hypothetical protein
MRRKDVEEYIAAKSAFPPDYLIRGGLMVELAMGKRHNPKLDEVPEIMADGFGLLNL